MFPEIYKPVRPAQQLGCSIAEPTVLLIIIIILLNGCGPAFQPKQARFVVSGCQSVPPFFEASTRRAKIDWEVEAEPVLKRGEPGTWDSEDVLNPSVIRVGGTYYNLYSGFNGATWQTGLATSTDGRHWEKQGAQPVLSPDPATWEDGYMAANGAAYHDGERFLYWYQAGARGRTKIGLAQSSDAVHWQKHPQPVLKQGPRGSWEEAGIGDPYVIRCDETYYIYYLGQNRFGLQRLGLARSKDGIHWQKSHANPLLDVGPPGSFDEKGLGEPAVFFSGDRYYMLYTGRDRQEDRRLGWAVSTDGVDWEKMPAHTVLAGRQPWNRHVVCDPTVWFDGDRLLVWFGGGDRPSPDENLNGQVGLGSIQLEDRGEAR